MFQALDHLSVADLTKLGLSAQKIVFTDRFENFDILPLFCMHMFRTLRLVYDFFTILNFLK